MFESHKTATGRKKFKRYFTGHDNGKPGKGSWQRDKQVAEDTVRINWCRTFHGDKYWSFQLDWCEKCHTTGAELYHSKEE